MFGRKKVVPAAPGSGVSGGPPADREVHPGHQAVLRQLRERDATEPAVRLQLAGTIVFDLAYRLLQNERGVRIEDLLALLSSVGGHFCLTAVLDALAAKGTTPQKEGMFVAESRDGHIFYFGDAPNRLLLESPMSLLSLALGAAQHNGAAVSLEMVHDCMRRVAASVGSAEFGDPQLPSDHMPAMSPFEWVRHGRAKLKEALDLYEVPAEGRPTAMGFAIQKAIDGGKDALDPLLAARIVVECAVPASKIDPKRFG